MRRAALLVMALAACGGGSPAQDDGGSDATVDVVEETAPDASDAADELADVDAAVPCGIDTVWTTDLPQHLECTGLYTDFASKTVDAKALSYTPGLVLWSDGATKSRWLYLPPNSKIDDSNLDEWTFPVGTKVWKEFVVSGARIETRLFTKASDGTWLWAAYQWTSDESDAVRNDSGAKNVVGTYEIPSHGNCDACHGGRNDKLLGVEAIALALPAAQGATLDWLQTNGKLTVAPPATTATLPEDSTGKAALALGSLHIGCGVSCHNQNGSSQGGSSGYWARLPASAVLSGTAQVTSLDTYVTTVGVTPTTVPYQPQANQGYKRILAGDAAMSLLVYVTNMRGTGQMPPIVTHVVDATSVQELEDWINAL